jgi:hypothetical protein
MWSNPTGKEGSFAASTRSGTFLAGKCCTVPVRLEINFQPNIELSIQKRIIILLIDFMAARMISWSSNFLDALCLKKLKLKTLLNVKNIQQFQF